MASEVVAHLEHIRHRRAKHAFALPAGRRLVVPHDGRVPVRVAHEAALRVRPPDFFRVVPLRQVRRIAVVAAGRDLGTAPPGVEGVVGPFDG
ncbi:hypothetical protein D3C85_1409270 [compost metagenome]